MKGSEDKWTYRGFCKLGQNNGIGSSNCKGEGNASISHNCLTLHALKVSCISFGLLKRRNIYIKSEYI